MSTLDHEPPTKKRKFSDDVVSNDTIAEPEVAPSQTEGDQTTEVASKDVQFTQDKPTEEPKNNYKPNVVNAEELNRLREFLVLDEVKSNDGDSDANSGTSEDVTDEEIEKMLDEDLPEGFKGPKKPKEKFVTKQKIVLEEKGVNRFEVLPLDWMLVRHYSGMPVYFHKTTRVCTLSRPYFLGKSSARRHDVPLSAIPCLSYRRALEEEEKQKEIDREIAEKIAEQNNKSNSNSNLNAQNNVVNNTVTDVNATNDSQNTIVSEVETNSNSENITVNNPGCNIEKNNLDNCLENDNHNEIEENCEDDKSKIKLIHNAYDVSSSTTQNKAECSKNRLKGLGKCVTSNSNKIPNTSSVDGKIDNSERSHKKRKKSHKHNERPEHKHNDNSDKCHKSHHKSKKSHKKSRKTSDDSEHISKKSDFQPQPGFIPLLIPKTEIIDEELETNEVGTSNQIEEENIDVATTTDVLDKNTQMGPNETSLIKENIDNSIDKTAILVTSHKVATVTEHNVDGTNKNNTVVEVTVNNKTTADLDKNSDSNNKNSLVIKENKNIKETKGSKRCPIFIGGQVDSSSKEATIVNQCPKNSSVAVENIVSNKENTTDEQLNIGDNNTETPVLEEINGTNSNSDLAEKDKSTNNNKRLDLSRQLVTLPGGIVMPPPRVETVDDFKSKHVTYEELNEYCKRLFKFKTINITHFDCWADRRKFARARKTVQYPVLPAGTKLITIPASTDASGGTKSAKHDWVMNMNGCSYLSVFHEYVRRALHKQPTYHFQQLENAASPYQATVYIGDMQYGVGTGSSKRQAKAAAAKDSIHILIPEMKDSSPATSTETDLSFFESVGVEDPRVPQLCAAACEPSPHGILRICLLRNFGASDRHIDTHVTKLEYQKIEFTMKVGKHSATVICKNKKTAKQRASQAILQSLHPHVRSWGSLLRLYGARSVKTCKEKKLEEQQITLLQDNATQNQPNFSVLNKLREEMIRLKERDEAVVPIGTLLLPTTSLPTHSGANLNNVSL